MSELEYKFTNDTLFKMLFVQYPLLLKKLVAILLNIRFESIGQFEIRNPEMPPEHLEDKFCRLDITMTVDGQRVDLEVQVKDEGDYPERTLFNWAREYSTALPKGGRYSDLPRTVILSIIDFDLFGCEEYYSHFQAREVTRHTLLSDRLDVRYFELRKLPKEVAADNGLELWLSLFRAKTEEDLLKLEAMEVPEMKQAIEAYRHITVTPEFREAERMRSKARHDEAQALYNAENKGRREEKIDVAKNLMKMAMPLDKIATATGLTRDELESLQNLH
jgi:predicted transposase/invertase (TIGR01784 family)